MEHFLRKWLAYGHIRHQMFSTDAAAYSALDGRVEYNGLLGSECSKAYLNSTVHDASVDREKIYGEATSELMLLPSHISRAAFEVVI